MTARLVFAFSFLALIASASCGDANEEPSHETGVGDVPANVEVTTAELRKKPPRVCKGKIPKNYGQACNCFGTIDCEGTCNVGKSSAQQLCEGCGGTFSCVTGCNIDVSQVGELCCNGLGTITCGGGCSFPCP